MQQIMPPSFVTPRSVRNVCNVFWQVGSSATIGTYTTFVENILALESITVNTGATVDGRVLARNGAVTLQSNTIGQTVHLESIVLAPASGINSFNTSHTVTATVSGTGDPVVGRRVTFNVVSGPNAGLASFDWTDSNGQASFTYMTRSSPGTDTIEASFVNSQGATVTSNQVTKNWTGEYSSPVGGEISPIDKLSVLPSQYTVVIVLLTILLVPLGFLLVKKRNKMLSLIIRFLPHL